jgi:hypothetical protein
MVSHKERKGGDLEGVVQSYLLEVDLKMSGETNGSLRLLVCFSQMNSLDIVCIVI